MTSLTKLPCGNSDKGTAHSYLPLYDFMLERYQELPITIIEIGVADGGSLLMWSKFFTHPDAKIIGVDIMDKSEVIKKIGDDRIKFFQGSQSDKTFLDTLPDADIIIDDGSHIVKDQIVSFTMLFSKVKEDGIYFVEDVQGYRAVDALKKVYPFIIYDLRLTKNRMDDILMVARK